MTKFYALALALLLTACGGSLIGGSSSSYRSHGPAVHGYGPIAFGTKRDVAYQMLQGRGQFEQIPDRDESVLVYMDYIDYLLVRVVQHFDAKKNTATKAEVFVADAHSTPKTLSECRSVNFTLYQMLQNRYGPPDWDPRVQDRRYGESGALMYTFADGSNIMLSYDYAAQDQYDRQVGLCTVKLTYSPTWAGEGAGGD